jgi:hypothetical protein
MTSARHALLASVLATLVVSVHAADVSAAPARGGSARAADGKGAKPARRSGSAVKAPSAQPKKGLRSTRGQKGKAPARGPVSKGPTVSKEFQLWSNTVRGPHGHVSNGGNIVGKARVTLTETTSGYQLKVRVTDPGNHLVKKTFTLSIRKSADTFFTRPYNNPRVAEFGRAEGTTNGGWMNALIEEAGGQRTLSINALRIPRKDGSIQVVSFTQPNRGISGENLISFPTSN